MASIQGNCVSTNPFVHFQTSIGCKAELICCSLNVALAITFSHASFSPTYDVLNAMAHSLTSSVILLPPTPPSEGRGGLSRHLERQRSGLVIFHGSPTSEQTQVNSKDREGVLSLVSSYFPGWKISVVMWGEVG